MKDVNLPGIKSRAIKLGTCVLGISGGALMAKGLYGLISATALTANALISLGAGAVFIIAFIILLDMHLENGKILAYRAKVRVSFRYHNEEN